MTDNEYGILLTDTGMWIESAADRTTLCTRLKLERNALPRVEPDYIQRPDSSVIDVRGRGYYVERGVVYKKKRYADPRLEDGVYLPDRRDGGNGKGSDWAGFCSPPTRISTAINTVYIRKWTILMAFRRITKRGIFDR